MHLRLCGPWHRRDGRFGQTGLYPASKSIMPSVAQLVHEKPQTYQHEIDASRHDGVDGELETKSTFLGPCGARYSISVR